jgi:hypothetical protein
VVVGVAVVVVMVVVVVVVVVVGHHNWRLWCWGDEGCSWGPSHSGVLQQLGTL